jgi:hypothetical protein
MQDQYKRRHGAPGCPIRGCCFPSPCPNHDAAALPRDFPEYARMMRTRHRDYADRSRMSRRDKATRRMAELWSTLDDEGKMRAAVAVASHRHGF